MALDEIDGLKINPIKLKEQCALIAQNYDYENALYVLLSDRVAQMCEEDELRGKAITGFKLHLSNYKSVFDALCYANELDKYDINTLISLLDSELGSDILDGTEILGKIEQAEADYESYSWKRDDWYSEYMNAKWHEIVYSDLCYYTYKYYEKLAEDALEDKEYWEGRGKLLLSISAELSGLFVSGNEFRDCANDGINQITVAYDADTNTYLVGDTSWKDNLMSLICESLYTEAGEVDWNLIEQILSKDADAISDSEYMLVAYAYMSADVDKLNDFFMMCAVPEKVDQFAWATLYNEGKLGYNTLMGNPIFTNKNIVTLDSAKIEGICRQANIYQTNLLAIIRYGNLDDSSKIALIAERDDIVQKITLAQTLNGIHSFYGSRGGNDYFKFEVSDEGLGKDESLKVTYNSLVYGNLERLAFLEPHTVTVINTLTDSGLLGYSNRKLEDASLKELTSYSTAIVRSNITDEAVNNALGYITGGGFAAFGLGLAKDIYENEKAYSFICDAYDTHDIVTVATYFDCCGNIVLYDDNRVSVSVYEGTHTDQNVVELSALMNNRNLDTEYLLEHAGDVFQECCDYMEEYGDKELDEVVDGD